MSTQGNQTVGHNWSYDYSGYWYSNGETSSSTNSAISVNATANCNSNGYDVNGSLDTDAGTGTGWTNGHNRSLGSLALGATPEHNVWSVGLTQQLFRSQSWCATVPLYHSTTVLNHLLWSPLPLSSPDTTHPIPDDHKDSMFSYLTLLYLKSATDLYINALLLIWAQIATTVRSATAAQSCPSVVSRVQIIGIIHQVLYLLQWLCLKCSFDLYIHFDRLEWPLLTTAVTDDHLFCSYVYCHDMSDKTHL